MTTVVTRQAAGLAKGDCVLVPLFDAGLLVARAVRSIERLDEGKWVEVETDDGLRRLVGRDEQVVVLSIGRRKGSGR
jgi:hypothetical protein